MTSDAPPSIPSTSPGPESPEDLLARLHGVPRERADELLLDLVVRQLATVLQLPDGERVQPAQRFADLGLGSLAAVDLHRGLAAATGLPLPLSMAFDRPTAADLTDFLARELFGDPDTNTAPTRPERADDHDDPIVLVGMGCRFPGGVGSPEDLWQLVLDETDAITDFPDDRGWDTAGSFDSDPDRAGKTYVLSGGFLPGAADFDAEFFAVSPREAQSMDPQQRLLLEVSWEAVERSGIDPTSLAGTATGVFVGMEDHEYGPKLVDARDGAEGYLITGNAASVGSGRIAYAMGLEGPVLTVDTACSGSLVALHLAARSLARGECDLALAGGAAVMSTMGGFLAFSRQRGLAADGRCKAFGEDADGTGWGEGVGMVVLERLSDARRRGHHILAVLRGSAINSDGATNGLTAPSGRAQQRVIRQALANAGVAASDVDIVEAHGTGTTLGDLIEAQALLATYGQDRAAPLWLGSLKTNIGHTQAAAGVAGVIKTVMAMRHGVMPRTLHSAEPSSRVDWASGAVELLRSARQWPRADRPRRAGVSAFGFSGTNAHLILEEAPEPTPKAPRALTGPVLLSAPDPASLRDRAESLAHADLASVLDHARSAATTPTRLPHRAAVVAFDADELRRGLSALAAGKDIPGVVRAPVGAGVGKGECGTQAAFLFTGHPPVPLADGPAAETGVIRGAGLYERFPVFADALDAACAQLDVHLRRPLGPMLRGGGYAGESLDDAEWAQPAAFAVEIALFRLLESFGVTPSHVIGQGAGEITAAQVAGVLTLADAAALVAARGRLTSELALPGAALAHALGEMRWVAEVLTYAAPRIPVVSGRLMTDEEITSPEHWANSLHGAAPWSDGLETLRTAGVPTVLALGPAGTDVVSLRAAHEPAFLTALAELHVRGVPVKWNQLHGATEAATREPAAFSAGHVWPGVERTVPWVLSGRSVEAVRGQAVRLLDWAEAAPAVDVLDVGRSLVTSRALFDHRLVVTGGDRVELLAGLRAVVAGEPASGVSQGSVSAWAGSGVVFVFPGQGGQWVGMARELVEASEVFAAGMAECAEALGSFVEWSLWDVLGDEVALGRV
ncbi:acyl transferase domain-containing protein/acyl carrier protein, partial [Streptomyces zagrosensis]